MSAAENRAVFLSSASQDAEAARKICEALRAAGIEVWFDQSELAGGDDWDKEIRAQIDSCALFVALVAERPPPRVAEASAAFVTPTIVHFGVVLFLSAAISAPCQYFRASQQ